MGNHFRTSGDEQSAFTPPAPEAAAAPAGAVAQPDNQEQPLPLQEDLFSQADSVPRHAAPARDAASGDAPASDGAATPSPAARIFGHPVAGVHPGSRGSGNPVCGQRAQRLHDVRGPRRRIDRCR